MVYWVAVDKLVQIGVRTGVQIGLRKGVQRGVRTGVQRGVQTGIKIGVKTVQYMQLISTVGHPLKMIKTHFSKKNIPCLAFRHQIISKIMVFILCPVVKQYT